MTGLGAEALGHLVALLRMDTSNPGPGEAEAAVYVTDVLTRLGVPSEVLEPEPGRTSVVARIPGADPSLPALVVHGHLDVVPADPEGWTHDPFGGEVADGCVWGRGAVDMKAMVAMMLTAAGTFARGEHAPRRTIVLAFFADEEAGSALGSRWAVEHRPDLFSGATEAIGEVGGFTVTLPGGARVYPLQTAERGMLWSRVTVPGDGGHAAFSAIPNPVERAASLVGRIGTLAADGAGRDHARAAATRLGVAADPGADEAAVLDALGPLGTLVTKGAATTFVATVISAGSKINVIPDRATVGIDCRFLPGEGPGALAAIRSVLEPDMSLEIVNETPGARAPGAGALLDACAAALLAEDPRAQVFPFTFPASTDGQHLARLGIAPYGFAPLVMPDGFDALGLFHTRDERVPVDAVVRGMRVLLDFLTRY